jgi:hypothetical protein
MANKIGQIKNKITHFTFSLKKRNTKVVMEKELEACPEKKL